MRAVTNVETGLFPAAYEIRMSCSCPDWAGLCKHLAAVLYGVGARLDARPELLFTLRGVDPSELVAERAASAIPEAKTEGKRSRRVLPSSGLSDVFGIEFERAPAQPAARATARPPQAKHAAAKPSLVPKKTPHTAAPAPGVPARAVAHRRALVPERRSASDVTETAALIAAFVKSHPGVGVEVIGPSLGLSTRQLSLPIRKLIAMGSIVSARQKRATKYLGSPQPPRRPRSRSCDAAHSDAVIGNDVDDRVRKSRQQIAPSARVVGADRPDLGPVDDPLDGRNQFGAEVIA